MSKQSAAIALAGQPNVGKSTVFNILTGLNQHVGNWPGKTVEQRTGQFEHDGVLFSIIDLPGTYCLTAASPEELVSRDYIIHERPDVVVVIINAASMERNLYLVAELLALPAPLVIGLNMMDVAQQEGFDIEPEVLSAALGVPVVPMVSSRNQGVHELVDEVVRVVRNGPAREPNRPEIREDHRAVLERLQSLVDDYVPAPYPPQWVALKLLEGDQQVTEMMREALPPDRWEQTDALLREHEDAIIAVAGGRYEWIRRMTRAAFRRPHMGHITLTQRLDRVATHPFWGLLTLAAVLALIFGLTYSVGIPMQEWIEDRLVLPLADWAEVVLAGGPEWLRGLVVDGAIGGVGLMLTFLPILFIFFTVMGLLEDMGYMARAAYVMDRFMHSMGLHGKSFLPLFLGFGCNVPAVMGTRIIESRRSRLLTMMLAPLVPCPARLAVLAVLAPAFFPNHATLATWALTGLPLVTLALSGMVIHRIFGRGEQAAFIMEMPLYHVPNARTIGMLVQQRIVAFLKKAGTVILGISVLIWALAVLPHGEIETSFLAMFGRLLAPVGSLMGLDWRAMLALLTSFAAKENAIATLGVLYGVGEDAAGLSALLSMGFTPASGLAFLVAQMLFIPCISTVVVIKQESGSWKWMALDMLFLAVLTLVAGVVAYHLGLVLL
ncbi:MAG TPA: ferrous iron transport protein B [Chloroflexi bacterium]|jgi:ferrous iron transport protein B|nr:ferrous iron transport protein B [Chloroflexota bacterium]